MPDCALAPKRTSALLTAVVSSALLAWAIPAAHAQNKTATGAQNWPAKPVRMISPFPPGGGIDTSARVISQALTAQLGQQFVVENRPGASGRIGTEIAAKAPPDGYTLVMGSVAPNAILPGSGVKLTYDAIHDFMPVSLVAAADYALVVHPSLPARTMKEIIALAKAQPGQLTFASSGYLGAPHLAGELMNYVGKLKTVHVPYNGTAPAALAVLIGETVMGFASGPAIAGYLQTGRLRAVATTGAKRSIPNVPTMSETLPGCVVSQWYGVLAPAGTPQAIVDRLQSEIGKAIQNPKVVAQFAAVGTDAISSTPADFAALIKADIDKWGKVIRAAGIDVPNVSASAATGTTVR